MIGLVALPASRSSWATWALSSLLYAEPSTSADAALARPLLETFLREAQAALDGSPLGDWLRSATLGERVVGHEPEGTGAVDGIRAGACGHDHRMTHADDHVTASQDEVEHHREQDRQDDGDGDHREAAGGAPDGTDLHGAHATNLPWWRCGHLTPMDVPVHC